MGKRKLSIEEIEYEMEYGKGTSRRETLFDKIKVLFGSIGFFIILIVGLYGVGYIISAVVDKTSTHATEITNAADCRNKGYAWHEVSGCMTQEMFRENYIDR